MGELLAELADVNISRRDTEAFFRRLSMKILAIFFGSCSVIFCFFFFFLLFLLGLVQACSSQFLDPYLLPSLLSQTKLLL